MLQLLQQLLPLGAAPNCIQSRSVCCGSAYWIHLLRGGELEQISIHTGQQEAVHHHVPTLATIEEQHSSHLEPPVSSPQVRWSGALLCCWTCHVEICDVAVSLHPVLTWTKIRDSAPAQDKQLRIVKL